MVSLRPFTTPGPHRWQRNMGVHNVLFLIKNVVLISFVVLIIIDYVYFKKWWEANRRNSWSYSPHQFWFRIGMALVPDLIVSFTTLILIFNPFKSSRNLNHPIFALISSFALFSLYLNCIWINWLIVYSNEVPFENMETWRLISHFEMGIQAFLALIFFVMFIFGCMATHRWRLARERERIEKGVAQQLVRMSG